jgi:hypothetical protein
MSLLRRRLTIWASGTVTYRDTVPRDAYLKWTVEWCCEAKRLATEHGLRPTGITGITSRARVVFKLVNGVPVAPMEAVTRDCPVTVSEKCYSQRTW